MKVSIAINNYNYSYFIVECVESVLNQTYHDIEIIIVDDGSTDNSLKILKKHYSNNEKIRIIEKENGGQLSSFNETVKYITGEIICFLDADDLYKPTYIEGIVDIYNTQNDISCIFTQMEKFFIDGNKEINQSYSENKNLGFSIISALYAYERGPSPTSGISMRSKLFKKIIPIALEEDWITNADVCLDWGASMYGAKRYYYSKALVSYRIHGNNLYYGRQFSDDYLYKREVEDHRLLNFFKNKTFVNESLCESIVHEYKTRDIKKTRFFKMYVKILMNSNIGFMKKPKLFKELLKEFIKKRKQLT